MSINQLQIKQFRILNSVDISTGPGFNVFYGINGSGKTSILEAIYYLSMGRSFRTSQSERIIQHHHSEFSIFAQLNHPEQSIPIGLERNIEGGRKVRIDGQAVIRLADLAKKLPTILMSTENHRFFHDGPKERRQFLDWGLFHVEQGFFATWQDFQRILKQRNAALKNKSPISEIRIWDKELIASALQIDDLRLQMVQQLEPLLNNLLDKLLYGIQLEFIYFSGWDSAQSLADCLHNNIYRDIALGYTQLGPQRADLQLKNAGTPAEDYLSQGQQKLAAYALKLAQGLLMQQTLNNSPVFLIDDLPSELDPEKRAAIMETLQEINAQVFVTGIIKEELQDIISIPNTQLFHVKQGVIETC